MFLMTLRLKFLLPSEKKGHECEYIAQNPILIKISSFSQKVFFSSKTFPGHTACNFDNPRELFLPTFGNLLTRSRRTIEYFLVPRKAFSSERYTRQVDCRFGNPAGKSQPRLPYFSSQSSRITKKNISRKK